jgi:hypothetical protein
LPGSADLRLLRGHRCWPGGGTFLAGTCSHTSTPRADKEIKNKQLPFSISYFGFGIFRAGIILNFIILQSKLIVLE